MACAPAIIESPAVITTRSAGGAGTRLMEGVGTRVIRGPNWKWGKQVRVQINIVNQK